MSSRGVGASNDAFAGGAQQRNLYPPGVGGAIGSANTRVGAPVAGVNPGQIKSALNNSTSNIGIPYARCSGRIDPPIGQTCSTHTHTRAHTPCLRALPRYELRLWPSCRLVPLNNSNKLIGKDELGKTVIRKETEDLRATTIAFILGLRGQNKPPRPLLVGYEQAPGVPAYNVGYQPSIMPGMPGTERFQQLCSIEYLNEYFKQVLAGATIKLNERVANLFAGNPNLIGHDVESSGPYGSLKASMKEAELANIPENRPGRANLPADASMLKMPDVTKQMGLEGSDASSALENYQGIFARDFGPFLKGKGTRTELINCTRDNLPQVFNPDAEMEKQYSAQPFSVSRNLGDEVAFSLLESKFLESGLTDWRPDGIVLSKGANDPSDKLSDEYLEARDGQLYNIRVQGPAVGTAWTGERSLEVLPLDKVFVVLVADVWFDSAKLTDVTASVDPINGKGGRESNITIASLMAGGIESTDDVRDYQVLRAKYLAQPLDEEAFKKKQHAAFAGTQENTVLANFRVMVSTSSQMINYSTYKSKGNQFSDADGKRRRLLGASRMGLTLSNEVGEYIVGGWQIGNVLDTAASRAAMPAGNQLGIRSAAHSAAMNINVNVSWFSADRLCRSFNNPENTVKQRFEAHRRLPQNKVNMQLTKSAFDITGALGSPAAPEA